MSNKPITKEALTRELLDIVASEGMVDVSKLTLDAKLADLDIKSADFILILMEIEEKYDVYLSVDNDLSGVKTVAELLDVATRKVLDQLRARGG